MFIACRAPADEPADDLPQPFTPGDPLLDLSPGDGGPDGACDENANEVDGDVDESCYCKAGELRPCYDGPAATLDVGRCEAGVRRCVATDLGVGTWGHCADSVLPAAEICGNDVDEDCDGVDPSCEGANDPDDIGAHD
jgi:hypothetical protein